MLLKYIGKNRVALTNGEAYWVRIMNFKDGLIVTLEISGNPWSFPYSNTEEFLGDWEPVWS